jgi:SAM-dependent methyltransferase
MTESKYAARIEQEIAAFRQVDNVHKLPDIYHRWAGEILLPRMQVVLGTGSNVLFYALPIAEKCSFSQGPVRITSIGAGDGSMEIEIARELIFRNQHNFQIECLELSPDLVLRARANIEKAGVGHYVTFTQTDINTWVPERAGWLDVLIANQFLHHVVELEFLFEQVGRALKNDGLFLTTDVIGRNGHMRWPEALMVLDPVWQCLPDRYKYNQQLQRLDTGFVNWDCSAEGFEGVRAQDILPLLLQRFHFHSFLAFGNLVDPFVDRGYGHNFDPQNADDAAFITALSELNDVLIDNGVIKPTMMFACMAKTPAETRVYRHWNPAFCIRDDDHRRDTEISVLWRQNIADWHTDAVKAPVGIKNLTLELTALNTWALQHLRKT